MSTIKDVASLAGVSPATVSIIINGRAAERSISLKTQQRVQAAIKELNYRPNVSAKKLRSNDNSEYSIGIYWADDFRTNFLVRIIYGIQQAMLANDYHLNLIICPYKSGSLCHDTNLKNGTLFHAAIIANTSAADMDYLSHCHLPIPVVLYNRFLTAYSSITIDNEAAGRVAADALLQRSFYDIGAVVMSTPYLAMGQRTAGFIAACQQHGISISENAVITVNENSITSGVQAGYCFMNIKQRPRAVFCDSDSLAIGFMQSLQRKGLHIPEDTAVIAMGMSSIENSSCCLPPLSVINIPMEEMAFQAVTTAVAILEHQVDPPVHKKYIPELIIRESLP